MREKGSTVLHKNVIENKGGFRTLDDAELNAVSGGTEGEPIIVTGERDPWVVSIPGEALLGLQGDAWISDSNVYNGEHGDGGGSAPESENQIIVTPGEMQQLEINGEKAYVILNHEEGTFVEFAVGETNAFGYPTEFYPVGTGTFTAERTEAWSINLPFVSIPVTDIQYVLTRDPD